MKRWINVVCRQGIQICGTTCTIAGILPIYGVKYHKINVKWSAWPVYGGRPSKAHTHSIVWPTDRSDTTKYFYRNHKVPGFTDTPLYLSGHGEIPTLPLLILNSSESNFDVGEGESERSSYWKHGIPRYQRILLMHFVTFYVINNRARPSRHFQ